MVLRGESVGEDWAVGLWQRCRVPAVLVNSWFRRQFMRETVGSLRVGVHQRESNGFICRQPFRQ